MTARRAPQDTLAGTAPAACAADAALHGKPPVSLCDAGGLPADAVAVRQKSARDATRADPRR